MQIAEIAGNDRETKDIDTLFAAATSRHDPCSIPGQRLVTRTSPCVEHELENVSWKR
jgi:hypothetical protein